MSNVVDLGVITTLPIDPDRILNKAIGQLDRVMIIGIDKDGAEYFASSDPDGRNMHLGYGAGKAEAFEAGRLIAG